MVLQSSSASGRFNGIVIHVAGRCLAGVDGRVFVAETIPICTAYQVSTLHSLRQYRRRSHRLCRCSVLLLQGRCPRQVVAIGIVLHVAAAFASDAGDPVGAVAIGIVIDVPSLGVDDI